MTVRITGATSGGLMALAGSSRTSNPGMVTPDLPSALEAGGPSTGALENSPGRSAFGISVVVLSDGRRLTIARSSLALPSRAVAAGVAVGGGPARAVSTAILAPALGGDCAAGAPITGTLVSRIGAAGAGRAVREDCGGGTNFRAFCGTRPEITGRLVPALNGDCAGCEIGRASCRERV